MPINSPISRSSERTNHPQTLTNRNQNNNSHLTCKIRRLQRLVSNIRHEKDRFNSATTQTKQVFVENIYDNKESKWRSRSLFA